MYLILLSNEQQSIKQYKIQFIFLLTPFPLIRTRDQQSFLIAESIINWGQETGSLKNMNQIEWCWHILIYHIFKLSVNTDNIWRFFDSERIVALSHLVLHKATVFLHCHQLSETCQFWNTGWQTCILLLLLGMLVLFPYIMIP